MDPQRTREFVDSAADSGSVPALMDFVRVPNTSPLFDPDWATNGLTQKAYKVLLDWATAQNIAGFAYEVIASPQPDLGGSASLGPWPAHCTDVRTYGQAARLHRLVRLLWRY